MKDSKLVTVIGLVVAVAAVIASPDFVAVIGPKVAGAATLIGAVLAAVGRALGHSE